jgi:hypothetical protein
LHGDIFPVIHSIEQVPNDEIFKIAGDGLGKGLNDAISLTI